MPRTPKRTSSPVSTSRKTAQGTDPFYDSFVEELEQPFKGKVTGLYPVPLGIIAGNFAKGSDVARPDSKEVMIMTVFDGPEEATKSVLKKKKKKRQARKCWHSSLRRTLRKLSQEAKGVLQSCWPVGRYQYSKIP